MAVTAGGVAIGNVASKVSTIVSTSTKTNSNSIRCTQSTAHGKNSIINNSHCYRKEPCMISILHQSRNPVEMLVRLIQSGIDLKSIVQNGSLGSDAKFEYDK